MDTPQTPIYLVCGFLESGKTSLINSMLTDENFSQGERTLLIRCEEGIEEYDPKGLKNGNAVVCALESPEEYTSKKLLALHKTYQPERVIIEYNSVWTLKRLYNTGKPKKWDLAQTITLIDASTFENYINNMRTLMTESILLSDLVIFNRCNEQTPKSTFRRMIKAMNTGVNIIFENLDGTSDDGVADEDLPYDVHAEVVEISDDQFGLWYLDAMEHPDRYDGKTLHLKGQVYQPTDTPQGYYLFGRQAMTCCVEDIGVIGYLCEGEAGPAAGKIDQWIQVTVKAEAAYSVAHERNALVLHEIARTSAEPPEEALVTFSN